MLQKEKFLKLLGAHIKEVRVAKGMTQRELAAKIDKEETALQRIERGATNPTAFTLYELSEGLGVEPNELLKLKASNKK